MVRSRLLLVFLALPACTPTVVTGFNGDSIRIQSVSRVVGPDVAVEAQRICRSKGLQAEFASTQSVNTFVYNHLFLCLTNAKPNAGLSQAMTFAPAYLETTATL